MSSFKATAKDKQTGELFEVLCRDDHFGRHRYGYEIKGLYKFVMTEDEFFNKYELVFEEFKV